MSAVNIDPPKMTEQSDGLTRYLYRMVEQLNYALQTVNNDVMSVDGSVREANNIAIKLSELSEEEKAAMRESMLQLASDLAETANELYGYTDAAEQAAKDYADSAIAAAQEAFAEELSGLRDDLEEQIDSKMETWAQSTNPASAWSTAEERAEHDGDLWLYTGTSEMTVGSTTIKPQGVYQYDGDNNTWAAYSSTSTNLFDMVDGKTTIYYGSPTDSFPNAVAGDYLVDATTGSTYKRTSDSWQKVTDYRDYTDVQLQSLQTTLEAQIDAKVETWAQSSNPASSWTTTAERESHDGDLWLYTGTSNLAVGSVTIKPQGVYQYDGDNNTWSAYSSTSSNLFDMVDGKSTIYYGTTSGSYPDAKTGDYLVDATTGCTYQRYNNSWQKVTDYRTYTDGQVSALQTSLQSQIDAKLETWVQSSNPATDWTTAALESQHDGDLWLFTGTASITVDGATIKPQGVYQYDADNSKWVAYSSTGNNLFDYIDGKSTIYYGSPTGTYSDVKIDDYLVDSTTGKTYRWTGSAWEAVTDYNTAISTVQSALEAQIDAKIETWAQSTNPAADWTTSQLKAQHNGDLWLYTGTSSTTIDAVTIKPQGVYQYNSDDEIWEPYSSTTANLFDLVDGKTTVYYGTTSDTYSDVSVGDLLIDDTDGSSYRWTGDEWAKVSDYKTYADVVRQNAIAYTDEQIAQTAAEIARTAQEISMYTDTLVTDTGNSLINMVATEYVAKSTLVDEDTSEYTESLKALIYSTVQQLSDSITTTFATKVELQDGVSQAEAYAETYIRESANGIEIGKSDSPYSVALSNDQLQFLNSGVTIAYISGNKLYITSAEVTDSLRLGKYEVQVLADYGIAFKWVG